MGFALSLNEDRLRSGRGGGVDSDTVDAAVAAVQAGQFFVSGKVHDTDTAAGSEGHRYRSALVNDRNVGASSLVRTLAVISAAVSASIPDEDLRTDKGEPLPDNATDAARDKARAAMVAAIVGGPPSEDRYTWVLKPNPSALKTPNEVPSDAPASDGTDGTED